MAVLTTAERLLAQHAVSSSQATFVYPTTTENGFGQELVVEAAAAASRQDGKKVYQMDTRPGAGSALAGYLNTLVAPSTSSRPLTTGTVSALVGSATLKLMAPSLLSLGQTVRPRPAYAIHVASVVQSPDEPAGVHEGLGDILTFAAQLSTIAADDDDEKVAIVLSGTDPKQIVGVGAGLASALSKAGYDLVHAFDGVEGGVEQTVFSPIGSTDAIDESTGAAESLEHAVSAGLAAVSARLGGAGGDSDRFFSYAGSPTASHVLVIPASASASHAVAALRSLPPQAAAHVGVLSVRVLRPWSTAQLLAALPASAETLHVYTEPGAELLLELVLGSAAEAPRKPGSHPIRAVAAPAPTNARLTAPIWAAQMGAVAAAAAGPAGISGEPAAPVLLPEGSKLVSIWGTDDAKDGAGLAHKLAEAFVGPHGGGVEPRLAVQYDNYSQGGLQHASLLLSAPDAAAAGQTALSPSVIAAAGASPSLVVIQNPTAVLAAYDPLSVSQLSPTTQVLVAAPGWTPEEYEVKFDPATKEALWKVFGTQETDPDAGGVWSIDIAGLAKAGGVEPTAVTELAVWLLYVGGQSSPKVVNLLKTLPSFANVADLSALVTQVQQGLKHVRIPREWESVVQEGETPAIESARAADVALTHGLPTQESVTESKAGDDRRMAADDTRKTVGVLPPALEAPVKPATLTPNALGPNPNKSFAPPEPAAATWRDAAKALIFPEAAAVESETEPAATRRPDLPEENYVITVSETRRLTPRDYDRNVFHLELSTAGTGLKYEIGEALGVHGWNDAAEVAAFLEWYGLDPDAVVGLPGRDDAEGRVEQRTVFQTFQQNLDIFGKPPKAFYEALAKVATVKSEKDTLRFIASAEGSSTFKKWSETDTVTYADVLQAFPSARLSLAGLVANVELIKPRHYSIASSQNFVGDAVHLLIVTVDWQTPKGTQRFGQCTRYLASLKKGDKVMVSIKPSVMKLPKDDAAPVIMAGLGTGAAPFRAFIQERAWQRQKGIDVGPMYYYFGSRHRSKEYLYGEELEAYMRDGIVTHAGLAFSRDGPDKVYIQHKMNADAATLAPLLLGGGAFYLCGPTWPVPDVYEALCSALETATGKDRKGAEAVLEELKEKEAYILEVY